MMTNVVSFMNQNDEYELSFHELPVVIVAKMWRFRRQLNFGIPFWILIFHQKEI